MTRPPLLTFVHEDDDDDFALGDETKRNRDWALRRAEKRKHEEWLDACSDPPDESVLYGETLIVDGAYVGEWRWADKSEPDELPFVGPSHHVGVRPLSDEEREALIIEQRKKPKKTRREVEREAQLTEGERIAQEIERIRAELRAMPVPPEYVEIVRESDERQRTRPQREAAQAAFYKAEQEKRDRKDVARRVEDFKQWSAAINGEEVLPDEKGPDLDAAIRRFDPDAPLPRARSVEPERKIDRSVVRVVDSIGIVRLVPYKTYELYGLQAIELKIDPPLWVLHMLGIDRIPGHD
jgi:hypothetical protein